MTIGKPHREFSFATDAIDLSARALFHKPLRINRHQSEFYTR
jgi:hypothetical protein